MASTHEARGTFMTLYTPVLLLWIIIQIKEYTKINPEDATFGQITPIK